jgi:CyaY protein
VDRISEQDYQARATPELSALIAALDAQPDDLFAELEADVLTIEFGDQTRYVVNSHGAARQIWLAAERSAWHFDYVSERGTWLDTKTQAELWGKLGELLTRKLGRPVVLQRPLPSPGSA